jgi:hypothetical protein
MDRSLRRHCPLEEVSDLIPGAKGEPCGTVSGRDRLKHCLSLSDLIGGHLLAEYHDRHELEHIFAAAGMEDVKGVDMKMLTPKQERFCQEIVIGQTLSDSYRVAFAQKTMSKKTINEKACRLAKMGKIRARITELQAPVVAQVQGTMANRLAELAYAIFLDPADCFDDFGRPLSIRVMPEHVRRAIAGYEVDPVSFVTKIKFVDKRGAIMDYSKLAMVLMRGELSMPLL